MASLHKGSLIPGWHPKECREFAHYCAMPLMRLLQKQICGSRREKPLETFDYLGGLSRAQLKLVQTFSQSRLWFEIQRALRRDNILIGGKCQCRPSTQG
jgi:hypothetical protein